MAERKHPISESLESSKYFKKSPYENYPNQQFEKFEKNTIGACMGL